jgi:hypothetical protein
MRRLPRCLAVLLLLPFFGHAQADLIGLGISGDRIYVQEYWSEGKPYYRIINFAEGEIAIGLVAPGGKKTGPWKIPARGHQSIPAPLGKPGGQGYVVFELNGREVGALPPAVDVNVPNEKGEATCMGYGGNGGQNANFWMVQAKSSYYGGDVIEVAFLIRAGEGGLQIYRKDDDRLPRGQMFLTPIDVTCETLNVQKDEDKFIVSLAAPKKDAAWHRVTARFQAPVVRTMKAGVVMGHYLRAGGGSGALARCIVLQPKANDKDAPVKPSEEAVETSKLQGVWDCYQPKTTKGMLLLVCGNRIFAMPYEDDERLANSYNPGEVFTLEKKDGKRFIVLRTGGRLEYTWENNTLRILQPAENRRDYLGFKSIVGVYKGTGR